MREKPSVIACGGGVVERADNRALLKERARVVWLQVTPPAAAARVAGERDGRPLLADGDLESRLAELLVRRAPWYAEVAELRVVTDGQTPEQLAEHVLSRLGAPA